MDLENNVMHRMIGILGGLFLLLGVGALLYTPLSAWMTQYHMDREMSAFQQAAESGKAQAGGEDEESQRVYESLLEDMQNYNREVYESGQSGLRDAWSYEQAPFDLTEYGLPTEIFGILNIPAMEEELPVYLGATEENMAKGVAVLGQTSMPIGGENTNCVIAGHRGFGGTPFFREIQKLQQGDCIYLTTYWGEKIYQVESIAIILPDDMEAVLIQEGRELLTLITCHPYPTATHRYIVYCSAVGDEGAEDEPASDQKFGMAQSAADGGQTESGSSQRRIQLEQRLPLLAIPLVILSLLILVWPSKKKKHPGKEAGVNEKNTF